MIDNLDKDLLELVKCAMNSSCDKEQFRQYLNEYKSLKGEGEEKKDSLSGPRLPGI